MKGWCVPLQTSTEPNRGWSAKSDCFGLFLGSGARDSDSEQMRLCIGKCMFPLGNLLPQFKSGSVPIDLQIRGPRNAVKYSKTSIVSSKWIQMGTRPSPTYRQPGVQERAPLPPQICSTIFHSARRLREQPTPAAVADHGVELHQVGEQALRASS